ncbi:tetratricopeptide repeat protein [Marinimicrobium sp. ABcell2]|uniref:tetratricopeptide repeat protein n=1 Tax=Marinimicrobium sp. ABcell2 TaxID=3069751 RepID=UPI0027B38C96|nr:tetratricopeptide repeat protein [Marinimicrobium sp. ABcell2]MDQ2076649.1 tetratricopeptide repeat protein [Marinimicrobium sp. ABcell2]
MKRRYWPLLLSCTALTLAGCGSLGAKPEPSVADLPAPPMSAADTPVRLDDMEAIENRYQRALQVAEDPELRRTIQIRLADLAMARSERNQQESEQVGPFFAQPIHLYQQLLADEQQVREDRLYYQLAKAYALDGRMEEADATLAALIQHHPESGYSAEARFRRAQSAFSRGDYLAAEQHYQGALDTGSDSFSQNALYMRGWAQFKQADYHVALTSFASVLDQLLSGAQTHAQVDQRLANLTSGQRQVLDDALRAMGLGFTHLDGPEGIVALEAEIGPRPYQHLLYLKLGETYGEQERYRDSAATYAHFVERNPRSDLAPDFSVREIETYERGNFPSLVLPAKEAFVRRYGLHSDYWRERDGVLDLHARDHLHQYLGELARHQHARAQRLGPDAPGPRRQAFRDAAAWYREFVFTFPEDTEVASMRFLLAEALNEAGDLIEALDAYERVAYTDHPSLHSAEAGYAAVLLSRQLADQPIDPAATDEEREERLFWQEHAIDNALRFAQTYPGDERASATLAHTAHRLLNLELYDRAAQVAEHLLALEPAAPSQERFNTWLVLGHSQFELEHYPQAEHAYWTALDLWPEYGPDANASGNVPRREAVRERIAASTYQRAQLALQEEDHATAITLLLASADIAPHTRVAESARYDAGYYLMETERWAEAEQVLTEFRRDYPEHRLSANLPARLATVYQAQEDWASAAGELLLLESVSDDPAVQRTSLYLAAELYERGGQQTRAIETYRRYAHTYSDPMADNMEAQYRLSQLYAERNDSTRRAFWLQRLVDTHGGAGSAQTGRSTYLAAYAASELAEASFEEFVSLTLRLPLQQSLTRKRAALERALKDQQAVAAYGVAEFTTQASHRMGAIYHHLSRDLMESERPQGLSLLELEQYDILLEEQAYPFEERAIEIYERNARRSWSGVYDQWIERSFKALADILPARYGKREQPLEVSRGIH